MTNHDSLGDVAFSDLEWNRKNSMFIFGMGMAQNPYAPVAFNLFFNRLRDEGVQVRRIIELGTACGGLTVLLKLYCLQVHADLITYDCTDYRTCRDIFKLLGIDYRLANIRDEWTVDEINSLVRQEGVTVMVSDNGDKIREFKHFAAILKPGDFLLSHDYSPDRAIYNRERVWVSLEITDEDVRDVCESHNLMPYLWDTFQKAAWLCVRKHDNG